MIENQSFRISTNFGLKGSSPYRLLDNNSMEISEVNKYLDSLAAKGFSERTLRSYAYDLLCLWKWLTIAAIDFKNITRQSLLEFIQCLNKFSLSPITINHRLVVADCLYQYHFEKRIPKSLIPVEQPVKLGSYRTGWMHPARVRRLSTRVKAPRKAVVPLTQNEVVDFFKSLKSSRDIAITGLMFFCGLRSRETINLKVSDVNLTENYARILGKGDKERIVPLTDNLIKVILKYLRLERPKTDSQHLFLVLKGPRRGSPLTTCAIRKIFRYHRKISGIYRANAHRFRHTFGANMAKTGIPLVSLMKLMGHADIQTTMKYVNLSAEDVRDAFNSAIDKLNNQGLLDEQQNLF